MHNQSFREKEETHARNIKPISPKRNNNSWSRLQRRRNPSIRHKSNHGLLCSSPKRKKSLQNRRPHSHDHIRQRRRRTTSRRSTPSQRSTLPTKHGKTNASQLSRPPHRKPPVFIAIRAVSRTNPNRGY